MIFDIKNFHDHEIHAKFEFMDYMNQKFQDLIAECKDEVFDIETNKLDKATFDRFKPV